MKRILTFSLLLLALGSPLVQSQAPAPAALNTRQQLQNIREANQRLLEQQTKTLQLLQEMEKTSQAIKTLGKRA